MQRAWKCLSQCLVHSFLVFGILLALTAAPAQAQDADGPDFTGVSDILYGDTYLLRNDDLVVFYGGVTETSPQQIDQNVEFAQTVGSSVGNRSFAPIGPAGYAPYVNGNNTTVRAAAGRMFNLPNDIVAFLALNGVGSQQQTAELVLNLYDIGTGQATYVTIPNTPDYRSNPNSMVMADFTGDGYDELVINYGIDGFGYVVSAVDVNNWAAGAKLGPQYQHPRPITSMSAGDFDGDGRLEIAAAASDNVNAVLTVLDVDPAALALNAEPSLTFAGGAVAQPRVVSGQFDDNRQDDEVVVAFYTDGGGAEAQLYQYQSAAAPMQLAFGMTFGETDINAVELAGGPIDPTAQSEQFVVAIQTATGSPVTTNAYFFSAGAGAFVQQGELSLNGIAMENIALGRFDATNSDGSIDSSLQLAVLSVPPEEPRDAYVYEVYRVTSFAPQAWQFSQTAVRQNNFPLNLVSTDMVVGDLQGRSLRLGKPEKVTISGHVSPRLSVGLPPMHIDWAYPSCNDPAFQDNCFAPGVVRILSLPFENYAEFNTEIKAETQSESEKTTSYTLATKETVQAKIKYGVPDVFSIKAQIKDAAKQKHETSVATVTDSYAAQSFDASVRTGFADQVWFDSYRFNIWSYPILGQAACPSDKPNCSLSEQLPLHVQFSGPDQIVSGNSDGNRLEWYQPPWEPGNLLSYPWTEAQLLAQSPRTVLVNRTSGIWTADTSPSNTSVNWTTEDSSSKTQGSTQSHANNFSTSVSVEGNVGLAEASGSVGFDLSTDSSTETLNTAKDTHGSATGFTVNLDSQPVPDYDFVGQTYILGQAPLTGTLQNVPLTTTVQTSGTLQLAFWANPLIEGPSTANWWTETYTMPDVALNHPQRWTWTNQNANNTDVMTFNQPLTNTSPYDQEYYYMRGLYITPSDSPLGPQVASMAVTDTVTLQARVYNYSLVDTNVGGATSVNVMFYAQAFDLGAGNPSGPSFVVGGTSVPSIPGFASRTTPGNVPNWVLAKVSFNPADYSVTQGGNVHLRFWVLVYMTDANGGLVDEMIDHGLTALPDVPNLTAPDQAPIEPYSNNVGVYKQLFYVKPLTPAQVAADQVLTPALALDGIASLRLESAMVLKHQLSTTVRNAGTAPMQPLYLFYYEGDPAAGGRLYDWEMIPYMAPGGAHVNRIVYTPQACGSRTVYVVASGGGVRDTEAVTVEGRSCRQYLPIIGKR